MPQKKAGKFSPKCGKPKNQMNSCTNKGVPRMKLTYAVHRP